MKQAMSFELTSTELALALGECEKLSKIAQKLDPTTEELSLDQVLAVKEKLLQLEEILSGLVSKLPPSNDPNILGLSFLLIYSFFASFSYFSLFTLGGVHNGNYIYEIFEKVGLTSDSGTSLCDSMKMVFAFFFSRHLCIFLTPKTDGRPVGE